MIAHLRLIVVCLAAYLSMHSMASAANPIPDGEYILVDPLLPAISAGKVDFVYIHMTKTSSTLDFRFVRYLFLRDGGFCEENKKCPRSVKGLTLHVAFNEDDTLNVRNQLVVIPPGEVIDSTKNDLIHIIAPLATFFLGAHARYDDGELAITGKIHGEEVSVRFLSGRHETILDAIAVVRLFDVFPRKFDYCVLRQIAQRKLETNPTSETREFLRAVESIAKSDRWHFVPDGKVAADPGSDDPASPSTEAARRLGLLHWSAERAAVAAIEGSPIPPSDDELRTVIANQLAIFEEEGNPQSKILISTVLDVDAADLIAGARYKAAFAKRKRDEKFDQATAICQDVRNFGQSRGNQAGSTRSNAPQIFGVPPTTR